MTDDSDLIEEEDTSRPVARTSGAIATVVVAGFAAIAIPGRPAGIGISLVALGVAGAVLLSWPVVLHRWNSTLGILGLALTGMAAVRSAEWVVGMNLLAATGLATAIAVEAIQWRAILAAPLFVLVRVRGAVLFLARPLAERLRGRGLLPAFRGAAIASAMLAVFGTLFATADRAFAELAGDLLLPDWDLSLLPARVLVFLLVGLGAAALARTMALRQAASIAGGAQRTLGRTEWTIALTVLDALFLSFVVVQVAVLFGGRDHVLSTSGLTYAEYARQGFFQLLAVGALTLGVVAAAVRWGRRSSAGETRRLQFLLGALCLLTLVVLASAFKRLGLYEEVFGYTRLRISVHATILWMAGIFVMLMVAGVRMRASWLPRAALAFSAISLLVFALANPDGLIADRNVERYEQTGDIDLAYLWGLSPDAVPALASLPPRIAQCAFWPHATESPEADSLLAWNYGRSEAAAVIPPDQPSRYRAACDTAIKMGLV